MQVPPWKQAPLSIGFPRPEYWSGLPCPPPGDLPKPGIESRSPALQADSLPAELPGKPKPRTVDSNTYYSVTFTCFTFRGTWVHIQVTRTFNEGQTQEERTGLGLRYQDTHAHTHSKSKPIPKGSLWYNSGAALSQAAACSGIHPNLNSLPRNWTWVACMKTRNPSHPTSPG